MLLFSLRKTNRFYMEPLEPIFGTKRVCNHIEVTRGSIQLTGGHAPVLEASPLNQGSPNRKEPRLSSTLVKRDAGRLHRIERTKVDVHRAGQ